MKIWLSIIRNIILTVVHYFSTQWGPKTAAKTSLKLRAHLFHFWNMPTWIRILDDVANTKKHSSLCFHSNTQFVLASQFFLNIIFILVHVLAWLFSRQVSLGWFGYGYWAILTAWELSGRVWYGYHKAIFQRGLVRLQFEQIGLVYHDL